MEITNRIQYYDQMKGIAIIMVVIGHITLFSFGYDPSDVVKMLGIFHMPIFFYISGYFTYKENTTSRYLIEKLSKRSLNLLVPFIVFGFLWCEFTNNSFIQLFLGGGGRYWFLWVLFLLSTFFIVYGHLIQNIKKEWLYITLWIVPYCIIMFLKLFEVKIGGIHSIFCINHINSYYRYFLIGYLCRKYTRFNNLLFKNEIVYGIGFILYFLQWRYCNIHNAALIFFGGLGAIIVLQQYLESKQHVDNVCTKYLSKIGKASLSIYVIHYFFIPNLPVEIHEFLNAENPFIWQLVFAAALSMPIIAASMFVGQLIESNKYLNLLFFGKMFHK